MFMYKDIFIAKDKINQTIFITRRAYGNKLKIVCGHVTQKGLCK